MNNLISQTKSLTMSSLEISELTGKEKKTIHRDIRVMSTQLYGEIGGTDLYQQSSGGINPDLDERGRCSLIHLDRKHTDCLLTGYSAKARMKVIERWHELEASQSFKIPQTLGEALQLAADQAKQIELQAPKVEFVNRFVESTGNKSFREVAKILKANEREFRAFLYESKVMYQLGGGWTAHANHIDSGRFYCTTGEANGYAYTTCKFTPKGIEYIAGKWISYKELK